MTNKFKTNTILLITTSGNLYKSLNIENHLNIDCVLGIRYLFLISFLKTIIISYIK